jgi:hypothetical protein
MSIVHSSAIVRASKLTLAAIALTLAAMTLTLAAMALILAAMALTLAAMAHILGYLLVHILPPQCRRMRGRGRGGRARRQGGETGSGVKRFPTSTYTVV